MKILTVDPRTIEHNPTPVRTNPDTAEFQKLVRSIKAAGRVVVPPAVYSDNGRLITKYGHRRVAAAIKAGLVEIEVITYDGPGDALIDQVIENQVREGLGATDEARAIWLILEDRGLTDSRDGKATSLIRDVFGWKSLDTAEARIRLAREMHAPPQTEEDQATQQELLDALETTAAPDPATSPDEDEEPQDKQMSRSATNEISKGVSNKAHRSRLIKRGNTHALSTKQVKGLVRTYNLAKREKNTRAIGNLLKLDRDYSENVDTVDGYNRTYHPEPQEAELPTRRTPEVKEIIRWLRILRDEFIPVWKQSVKEGKMSPEARGYVANRLDEIASACSEMAQWLREEK